MPFCVYCLCVVCILVLRTIDLLFISFVIVGIYYEVVTTDNADIQPIGEVIYCSSH